MSNEPFIGSLYSTNSSSFGPNIFTSSLVLSKIRIEETKLFLEVSLENLDYEIFSLEEFTHIVVGIAFQVKFDELQYDCCVDWCHIQKDDVENIQLINAPEEQAVNFVSCGIIPKHVLLQLVLKNISNRNLDEVDKNVLHQFFNTSLTKFIKKLHFIRTSRYLSKFEKQTITNIETVCIKTKDISVNKITKLFKTLTAADWYNNFLEVIKIVSSFEHLLISQHEICPKIEDEVIKRAEFCTSLHEKDIKYFVPSDCDFKTECSKHSDLYLLIFCKEFVVKDKKQFDHVEEEFLKMKKDRPNSVFILVDIDLLSEEIPFTPTEIVICHLKNGSFLSYNVLINESNDFVSEVEGIERNYVVFSKSDIEEIEIITKWAILLIPCPGLICPDELVLWYCKYCNEHLYFSFDSYIFCFCGRVALSKCKFECSDDAEDTHRCDEEDVKLSLEPTESLNLVIFGQNDDDINIWRNNVYYYLSSSEVRPTLKQLQNLVNDEKIKDNKKESIPCIINSSNKIYNLIRTPGICPNHEIADRQNGHQVLESLEKKLSYVNGICIIINVLDTRMKLKLVYYIEEILTYFHRDALKNILFCIVSSKDNKEKTKVALEELLKVVNVSGLVNGKIYFIDNEAYDKVKTTKLSHTEESHEAILSKWKKTELETRRLIDYISVTQPHYISLSVELMKKRQYIYGCSTWQYPNYLDGHIIVYQKSVFDYLACLFQKAENNGGRTYLEEREREHSQSRDYLRIWKYNF